jgi:coenzyme PQQ precursor peptide PqqA
MWIKRETTDSDTVLPDKKHGVYVVKTWFKPQVREQEVGLEVTSYLPAEIDVV